GAPVMSTRSSLLPAGTPREAFREMVRYETRLALRIPRGLFAGVFVPTMLLVLFGSIPSTNRPMKVLGGLTYFDVYVPVFLALVIAAMGLIGLPVPLASYREHGILRRLSTTSAPPAWVLAAQLILNLRFVAMELVLLLVVATTGFSLAAPRSPGGLALALALAIAALFSIGDIAEDAAERVAAAIADAGGMATAHRVDVTREQDVASLVEETAAVYGRLDYQFNNAGIAIGGDARDLALSHWRQVLDVDFYGVLYGTFAAYPIMARQGFGHIVNTPSWAGLLPLPFSTAYATAK